MRETWVAGWSVVKWGGDPQDEEPRVTSRLGKRAFEEVAKLSGREQEAGAAWLLEELASEREWEEVFAKSGEALAAMAGEAVREHRQGRTEGLEPDRL